MCRNAEEGSVSINSISFQNRDLRNFIRTQEETLMEIKKKPISMTQAVKLAMNLEGTLVERKFYEIAKGDPIPLKGFFSEMREQIEVHAKKLVSVMAELRKAEAT